MRGGRRYRLLRLRVFDQGLCHLVQGQRYLDRGHNHRYLVFSYQGRQEVMFIILAYQHIGHFHGSWELSHADSSHQP